ncbi:hypothetical protein F2Q70_00012048 [Brassica cretica]|uniref:DUF1985 domain-containing protein n=1 Tax=Brassica cretica TaxID=69181 RepID=A0A8S9LY99_BRACR|nr:hypothetical protein F2Q70_00012048 [Brassica cretica]
MEDPLRFSLEEFGTITGLNCGSFPDGYEAPDHNRKDANKQRGAHKDPLWQKIVGKRIRLALIIILDGVLIASQHIHRPTLRYVQMLDDVDAFLEFPWGRESFQHTIRCMKPPKFEKGKPVDSPIDMLVLKLKQETFRLTGFPLALQLLAFRAIPLLLSKIPAPLNDQTIMDLTDPNLPNHPSIELDAILQVEVNSSVTAGDTTHTGRQGTTSWVGGWPNERTYDKVTYMEQLIANNHCFSKAMWPIGDCSEPVFTFTPIPEQPVHKKHTVPRKRKESTLKPHKASKATSFDATPLNKPTSQSSPSHGLTLPEPDSAPPVYDSSALPYSPIPLFNPTPATTTPPTISPNPLFTPPPALTTTPTSSPNKPAGFSTHYSTPNAFAAIATLKGSTSRLVYQDPNKEHGVVEASDSSPDKTVRRVVDELKAQTTDQEVCELSDSSPAKKTKDHQPSEAD